MKPELVIFDLDGTLLNTLEDLKEAVNVAMRLHGFPLHTSEWTRAHVGHGVPYLVREAMPERFRKDEALSGDCLSFMLEYYSSHLDDYTHPYPGMQDLVRRLGCSGVRAAVCSNKFQDGAERLVRKFYPTVGIVSGAREGLPHKPDPAAVGLICKEAGVSPKRTVMVGDSATDILTARGAGIACIGVSWGYGGRDSLAGAERIADDATQLEMMLAQEA